MRKSLIAVIMLVPIIANAGEWGSFSGMVLTRWLPDHRDMELVEDFSYTAPDSVIWNAPKGSIINGASIPKFAWSVIGGPYEGAYRNASVIHDVACDEKDRPWKDVHRAFYTAMRASDVNPVKAKIMYAAVYHFGPRWGLRDRVELPPVSIAELGTEIYRIKFEAGPNALVSIAREGTKTTRKSGLFSLGTTEEVVGAVIEIHDIQPAPSEDAFRAMEALISEKDLSLEEIEELANSNQ